MDLRLGFFRSLSCLQAIPLSLTQFLLLLSFSLRSFFNWSSVPVLIIILQIQRMQLVFCVFFFLNFFMLCLVTKKIKVNEIIQFVTNEMEVDFGNVAKYQLILLTPS